MPQVLVRNIDSSKGRIKDASPLVTPEGYMSEAVNVDLSGVVGARRKRKGRSKKNTTTLESGAVVQGGYNFTKSNLSLRHDLVAVNGKVKIDTSDTAYGIDIITGLNATERVRFFSDNDTAFVINGTDEMREYSMESITAQSCTVTNGSTLVTFENSITLSSKHDGGIICSPTGSYHTIDSIAGPQSAVITSAYTGTTSTGSAVIIEPAKTCTLSPPISAPSAAIPSYWSVSTWNNIGDPPPDAPSASTTGSCWASYKDMLIHIRSGASYAILDKASIAPENGSLTYDNLSTASSGNTGAGACCAIDGDYIYFCLGGKSTERRSFLLTSPYTYSEPTESENPANTGAKIVIASKCIFETTGTGNPGVVEWVPVYGGTSTATNTNLGGIAKGLTGSATAMVYPGENEKIFLFYGDGTGASYIDSLYGWGPSPNAGDGVYGIASTPEPLTTYSDGCAANNNDIVLASGSGKTMVYSVIDNRYVTLPDLPSTLGDGAACVYNKNANKIYVVKGGNTTTIWEHNLDPDPYGEFQFAYSYYDTVTGFESNMTSESGSVSLYHSTATVTMVDSADTRIAKRLYFRKRSLFKAHDDTSVDNDDPDDGFTKWYWVADVANGTTTYSFDINVPDDYSLNGFDAETQIETNKWKYSIQFDGLVFYAGHPDHRSSVYYCDFDYYNAKAMPQRVPSENYVTVPDGESVVGLFRFKGSAYVATNKKIRKINTDPSGTYRGYFLSDTNVSDGLASHDSIIERPEFVFYLSLENGPSVFNGFDSRSIVDGTIASEFKIDVAGGLAKTYVDNAISAYSDNEIYLDVTGYGYTTNNKRHIYDVSVGGWTISDGSSGNGFFSRGTTLDANELFSLSYDGFVIEENVGHDNLGEEYEFESRTVLHDGGMPERNKDFIAISFEAEFEDVGFGAYRSFSGAIDACKPRNSIYSYIIEMGTDDLYRLDHSSGKLEHFMNLPDTLGASGAWVCEANPGYIVVAKGNNTKTSWFINVNDKTYVSISESGDAIYNTIGTSACWSGEYVYVVAGGVLEDDYFTHFPRIKRLTTPLDYPSTGLWSSMTPPSSPFPNTNKIGVTFLNGKLYVGMRARYVSYFDYMYVWDEATDSIYASTNSGPDPYIWDEETGTVTETGDSGDNPTFAIELPYSNPTAGTITSPYFFVDSDYSGKVWFYSSYSSKSDKLYELNTSSLSWNEIDTSLINGGPLDMAGGCSVFYDNQHHVYFLSQESGTVLQRLHVENREIEDVSSVTGAIFGYNIDNRIADFYQFSSGFGGQRGYKIPLPAYANGRRIQGVARTNNTGTITVYSDSYIMKPYGNL